jgi:L-amino acid N-acyltransferase YncA
VRNATRGDAEAIARIYGQGISERVATFQTRTPHVDEIAAQIAGGALLGGLADGAARRGYHKLIGKIFTSNEPSIALVRSCGWRQVGVHHRHGRLDGDWKDVLVVERLLGPT